MCAGVLTAKYLLTCGNESRRRPETSRVCAFDALQDQHPKLQHVVNARLMRRMGIKGAPPLKRRSVRPVHRGAGAARGFGTGSRPGLGTTGRNSESKDLADVLLGAASSFMRAAGFDRA